MAENSSQDSFKILVVDDSPITVKLVSEAVSALASVVVATDGDMAVAVAREQKPDLILLDIQMPGMDGLEVCRKIKSVPSIAHASIIFVTAYEQSDVELKAFDLGGVDYITKPVNTYILQARVKTHLKLIRQTRNLIEARNELSTLVSALPIFVSYWSNDLINTFNNDTDGRWFGKIADVIQGQSLNSLFSDIEFATIAPMIDSVLMGDSTVAEVEFQFPHHQTKYAQVSLISNQSFQGVPGFLMILSDITQRKRSEIDLKRENEQLNVTLQTIGDAVITTDILGNITFMNPIAEKLTGWSACDAMTMPIEQVMHVRDMTTHDVLVSSIVFALGENTRSSNSFDAVLVHKGGESIEIEDCATPIKDANGCIVGAIIVFHDVTAKRVAERKVARLVNHDLLTDLPNRVLLVDRASQEIKSGLRDGLSTAILVLDIDNFTAINDTYGYLVGDELIKDIATFLNQYLADGDTLCRQGSDEFAILCTRIVDIQSLAITCKAILAGFAREWQVGEVSLHLSISIGAAIAPNDCNEASTLYRHANSAMHEVKRSGKNNYRFYSLEIEERLSNHLNNANVLKKAIEDGEITVFYQPKVNGLSGEILGCEALARWQKPDGTMVYPDTFIPLAETTNLIVPMGEAILNKACLQTAHWQQHHPDLTIAVNVSAVQFNPSLVATVEAALAASGLQAKYLELEVTESMLLNDEHALDTFKQLKAIGVQVSMDDFGTGYSSLSYVKKFPLDILKIDQSFVTNMLNDPVDASIIRTIILLARNLNLKLVAEGVETLEHAQKLLGMGCINLQGYFFSRPVDQQVMADLLTKGLELSPEIKGYVT